MRKSIQIILIILVAIVLVFLILNYVKNKSELVMNNDQSAKNSIQENPAPETPKSGNNQIVQDYPLSNPKKRVTKKAFGMFVTSENSPVQPERFRGYHTGTDFEIFSEELEKEVSVRAICTGEVKSKTWAKGYGGVVVQQCVIENQSVTVIYGHLNLESIDKNPGNAWNKEEVIGILGKDKSVETDGERKHLHLGIHKGASINILGYVSSAQELSGWIDPCSIVCGEE